MNQPYFKAILSVLENSNISDLHLRPVEVRPVTYDNNGNQCVDIFCYASFARSLEQISDAWVAGNLLIFTAFDEYLENKYGLTEGGSFRCHYKEMPEGDDIQRMEKNCYRILKVIRNAIQHSISAIIHNNSGYDISYSFNGTGYKLQISHNGMDYLYTAVFSMIQGSICGAKIDAQTRGHYEGMLQWYYGRAISNLNIKDDIKGGLLVLQDGQPELEAAVRYPVQNPIVVAKDSNSITFKRYIESESGEGINFKTDYLYEKYLFPEEIGIIGENRELSEEDKKLLKAIEGNNSEESLEKQEKRMKQVITFDKSKFCSTWELTQDGV